MSTQQRDTLEEALPELHKQNPGATLRMEREKQGLTTAAAAGTLRLPEKILVWRPAASINCPAKPSPVVMYVAMQACLGWIPPGWCWSTTITLG